MTITEIVSKAAQVIFAKIKPRLDGAVTGVKGNEENAYRIGNVNLTPANIGAVPVSAVGTANGVAELDSSGKVLSAQLPSYVDDVLECASSFSFPAEGESGKIYVAIDTNLTYRWTGSAYVEISPSLALGETSATAYRGDRGKAAYDHAQTVTGNPHGVTKSDVGLGNADNTSDLNKPISTATQAALNGKVDKDGAKVLSDNNYTTAEKADLAAIKALLQNAVLCRTASGNPAVIQDASAANLQKLSVAITPSQSGSGDPSPSNVRPISGVSSVTVTRTGKNLCPPIPSQTLNGVQWATTDGVTASSRVEASEQPSQPHSYNRLPIGKAPFAVGETYLLSGCPAGGNYYDPPNGWFARAVAWKSDGTVAQQSNDTGNGASFTVSPEWASVSVFFHCGKNVDSSLTWRPFIRQSAISSAFEPYKGQTVTVPLVDSANNAALTVYGGTLDVTSGTLTVTWANIASYNGETLPGRWISDRDAYAAGTIPTTGAQVVYELATPVTYQLAAAQLPTLSGYNCVFADCGSVSVEYRADVALSLET